MTEESLTGDFIDFLVAAKQATYASQSAQPVAAPLLQNSKQLEYRQGDFLYRDIYVGTLYFVGQEIVYRVDRPIWSMSYAGGLCSGVEKTLAKPVYSVLRDALTRVPQEFPIRGPELLRGESLRYTFRHRGEIEGFDGVEEIESDSRCLYRVHVAGGRII